MILDAPFVHPPADAIVAVEIDGHKHEREVYLPDGLSPDKKEVRLQARR